MVEGASFVDQRTVPADKTLVEAFASLTITHQVIEAVAFTDELLTTLLEDASEGEVACSDTLGWVSTLDDDIEVIQGGRRITELEGSFSSIQIDFGQTDDGDVVGTHILEGCLTRVLPDEHLHVRRSVGEVLHDAFSLRAFACPEDIPADIVVVFLHLFVELLRDEGVVISVDAEHVGKPFAVGPVLRVEVHDREDHFLRAGFAPYLLVGRDIGSELVEVTVDDFLAQAECLRIALGVALVEVHASQKCLSCRLADVAIAGVLKGIAGDGLREVLDDEVIAFLEGVTTWRSSIVRDTLDEGDTQRSPIVGVGVGRSVDTAEVEVAECAYGLSLCLSVSDLLLQAG